MQVITNTVFFAMNESGFTMNLGLIYLYEIIEDMEGPKGLQTLKGFS